MNEKEIIKIIIMEIGWTQELLAKNMGFSTQSAVGNRLRDKNGMRVDSLVRMLDALGFELVIRSKAKQNRNSWVIDYKEEEE